MIQDDVVRVSKASNAIDAKIEPFRGQPADSKTILQIKNAVTEQLGALIDDGTIYDYVIINALNLFRPESVKENFFLEFTVGVKVRQSTDFLAAPFSIQLSDPQALRETA